MEHLKQLYLQWEYADSDDIPKKRIKINHLAKAKKITLINQPYKKYTYKGSSVLVDGGTGTQLFDAGLWLGFEANDLEAVVDLEKKESIHSVSVGFLQNASNWILSQIFGSVLFGYGQELL
ncbi:hypothetical protein [Saccharicrinis sp. GN24d3]|uniref:hypothetical protein n=1 Tax=Saccharicrinis sp. GN24d3 TaxID=3458416 RepID=UPI004035CBFE